MRKETRRVLGRLANLRKLEQNRRRAALSAAGLEHERLKAAVTALLAELANPPGDVQANYLLLLAHSDDIEGRIRETREALALAAAELERLQQETLRARGELALLDRVTSKET
jgi:hypothetical protein